MKPKLKIRTIEDIALQFIKRNEPIKKNIINSSKTLIDYKFCIKKYSSKNQENSFSQNYDRLVPIENKENVPINENDLSKMKVIKFYKIPQKDLGEEEECSFHSELGNESVSEITEIKSQRTYKMFGEKDIKFRNIKKLKYNKNLLINLNYQNIYNSITEIYYPLMQNFESISSLKSMTNNTLSCIVFFSNHDSIFQLKNEDEKDILTTFFTQLKIYENIEISLILFIMHIILESKIEYLDSFNEDDILVIYHDCFSVIQKFYEMIILIVLLKDNLNNDNKSKNVDDNKNKDSISFESLCIKYVKDFYKFSQKPKNNEDIVNKINDNITLINKLLLNSCAILFGNLILFRKDSGNLDNPDKIESFFLDKYNNENIGNNWLNRKEKIFLSKEFYDQYIIYKTFYLFFMKEEERVKEKEKENDSLLNNKNNDAAGNNTDKKEENKENISACKVILNKLNSMNSSFKEISYLFILYYTNFKTLLERNKVKPPYLPPLDTKKYKYSLILDLDETLVHYIEEENRAYVQVRPYADFFLNEMAKYFELVIFTAAAEDYADIVLNELDKNKVINYKLYRKHTEQINGVFIKDLSKLGRDLSKIVIVDNNKDNFSLQPENGLHICSFIGDQNDDELYNLSSDLMKIVDCKKNDIRPVIKEIKQIMKKRYESKNIILE